MGAGVQDLVAETEQVIQQYLQEDIETYRNTIAALEEISYQLWVESNTNFLDNSMMTSEDELEWDDEIFFDRLDDTSHVSSEMSLHENTEKHLVEDERLGICVPMENLYQDWVVIEDVRASCNIRQDEDWLVLSTVVSETDNVSSARSVDLDRGQFISDIMKASDTYVDVLLESTGSGYDLSDWAVLSMKITEGPECYSRVCDRSFDSGITSPEAASANGADSSIEHGDWVTHCRTSSPDVSNSSVGYCDTNHECTCSISKRLTTRAQFGVWTGNSRVMGPEWTVQTQVPSLTGWVN